jgi:hypothetical protein
MPNYQNSKIYKIVGNGLTYYGSTTRALSQRFSSHKCNKRRFDISQQTKENCTSNKCMSDPNCYITLVENYPCNTKEELQAREHFYIANNECVNIYGSNGRNRPSTCKELTYEQMIDKMAELHKRCDEMINRLDNLAK